MTLQRLKLIEVDDKEGSSITEFDSYSDIEKYSKGKTGEIPSPAKVETDEEPQESETVSTENVKTAGETDKKLLENKLQQQIQAKKDEQKDSGSQKTKTAKKSSDSQSKASFWDRLK